MTLLRLLLFPFSIIYDGVTRLRNHLFNIDYTKSFEFDRVVIGVGNLSVGGTGKTPMAEYLIRLLQDRYKLAYLSRGYGRKTRGFILAKEDDTAQTIGDEAWQVYRKFSGGVVVAVGEERAFAIPQILLEHPEVQVIILDDAFQHRTVSPQLNILLTDYSQPFYRDLVLPSGNLREARKGAKRANIIVVTKCPDALEEPERKLIEQSIRRYAGAHPLIAFSRINFAEAKQVFEGTTHQVKGKPVAFSGIARPGSFEEFIRDRYGLAAAIRFRDHHDFKPGDIQKIKEVYEAQGGAGSSFLVTTEKDASRLNPEDWEGRPLFFIPVRQEFIHSGREFDMKVSKLIENQVILK